VNKKQERLRLLEAQINRLRRRIDRLEYRSNRYSWARVAIFFAGLALSVIVALSVNWLPGVILAVITLLAFAVVAHYHGKIERSMSWHTILLNIQLTHIARMSLDWEHIPATAKREPQAGHPFEIDLDITGSHSIHRLLNVGVSQEGSRRLLIWLLNTKPDVATIRKRQALVRELTPMTLFRDKLLLKSLLTARRGSEHLEGKRLLNWLAQRPSSSSLPALLWGSLALNALTVVLFILSFVLALPQVWIVSLFGAIVLLLTTSKVRGDVFEDASYLRYAFATLSAVFAYLETYPYGPHAQLKKLCEPFFVDREHRPSQLLRRTRRITSAATLKNNGLLWLIVNALVPWDAFCAYRLSQYKAQITARLPKWLDVWFELEALNSLATFAYLNPDYTLPDIVPLEERDQNDAEGVGNKNDVALFCARDLGHPLIPVESKVTNDFRLSELGEVVIITGSNMSGKSTFLRTLGVNLCLAYAGAPVNASRLRTIPFKIFTCIRVSDSVTEGYSYFYAEVKRLRALLTELDRSTRFPLFFLIDEIFKGTNNRERLIGSRSYVRTLVGRNCIGAISTHDLELVKLADTLPQVENFHFREEVVDEQMVFDYQLRLGPCPTTNALKIMRMEGLPVEENE
jgi:ABC-type multidrug transport system fused ATPase/permease subunit